LPPEQLRQKVGGSEGVNRRLYLSAATSREGGAAQIAKFAHFRNIVAEKRNASRKGTKIPRTQSGGQFSGIGAEHF
jgi:hypothetical protein